MALNAVRAVLAVLLAAAFLGVGLPAAEEAAASRTAASADASADRIATAVDALVRNDATRPGLPGARRTVEVRVPDDGFSRGFAYIAVGGVPGDTVARDGSARDVVVVRLRGRAPQIAAVVPVDVRTVRNGTPAGDGEPLVVREDTTVVLGLVERDGRPVVHTFIRENAPRGARG